MIKLLCPHKKKRYSPKIGPSTQALLESSYLNSSFLAIDNEQSRAEQCLGGG